MISINVVLVLLSALPTLVHGQTAAAKAYTPTFGECPSDFTLIRQAGTSNNESIQTLSPSEVGYLQARKSDVLPSAWKAYLSNAQNVVGVGVPLPDYVISILGGNGSATPTLGIATSGGGYRAAIFGAGILNALDGRDSESVKAGTGGLLQAATYLTGLSGGSWLVTSLTQANFPPIQELIFGTNTSGDYAGWLPEIGVVTPSNDTTQNEEYIGGLVEEIKGKHDVGFPVTVGDLWARALSRHFVNGTTTSNFADNSSTHGAGITFSGLANVSAIASHVMPFPLVVANSVSPSGNKSNIITAEGDVVPLTNPIYEFSVYEMGSYDPMLSAFTPTKYLGTSNTTFCVTGYDQAALIAGTSSELFNELNVSATALANSTIGPALAFLNQIIPQSGIELDVARYPNPFFGFANETFIDSSEEDLSLVDGGEDGEVIPIQPLLVRAREVDVILAIDASGNATGWADGSSLIATQNRSSLFPSAYSFPPVPTTSAEFIDSELTTRPTFFGCNTSSAPLVIYIANGGPPRNSQTPPLTNTSTQQLSYMPAEIQGMLEQTWAIATQGIPESSAGDADPMWPACLACAVVDRARDKSGIERTGTCSSCFDKYCWQQGESSTNAAGKVGGRIGAVLGGLIVVCAAMLL